MGIYSSAFLPRLLDTTAPPPFKYAAFVEAYKSIYEANDCRIEEVLTFKTEDEMLEWVAKRSSPNGWRVVRYQELECTIKASVTVKVK